MDDMSWVFALAMEMDNALADALEQAEIVSEEWEDDGDLEMGFDPYMGDYSWDC